MRPFLNFSLALFHSSVVKFWNKWASKKKQQQQKNQTKACKHVKRCNLCYYNVSRYNNPQRENKIGSLSFEGFHAKLECKLTCMDGNDNQTANTHIVFIVSFSKKKKKRNKEINDEKYSQTCRTVRIPTNHDSVGKTAIVLRLTARHEIAPNTGTIVTTFFTLVTKS